jgi:hypothetical protein
MKNIVALSAELIAGHPDTGAYDADAVIAAGQLNVVNRIKLKTSLSGNDLFTSTDETEFSELTDSKKQMWISWCSVDRDPMNSANIAFVNFIFESGSQTMANLNAIRTEDVSRAVELGLGFVSPGNIENARY